MSQRQRQKKRQQKPGNHIAPTSQHLTGVDERLVAAIKEEFSGPLPHPEILENYNRIVPGAAERIIQMAESEKEHRHYIEKAALRADIREARLGQIFAFLIGTIAIVCGAYTAIEGAPGAGGVIGGGGVIGLVSVFILGRKKQG